MSKFSLIKQSFLISVMFLFLLTYSNKISATKVDASKFGVGFNAVDVTAALQGAIDSKSDTVLVPYMGADWIVRPIFLRSSNQTIIFADKVVVTAKRGEFHGSNDCLFSTRSSNNPGVDPAPYGNNVSLIGYGATFKMQKADYMTPAYGYQPGVVGSPEWRNCIYILSCSGTKVLGLNLRDSGGDGIMVYYGASNTLIKDVICDNNFRQGISPCDFKNLTIENCVLINTWDAPNGPCAGIDFEPDAGMYVQNGKMINCYTGNNSYGLLFALGVMKDPPAPVSIEIKHSFFNDGICAAPVSDNAMKGIVSFQDCFISCLHSNQQYTGLSVTGKSATNTYLTKFTDCLWQDCNPAIKFSVNYAPYIGNMQFANCIINEPDNQPTIRREVAVANITGNMTVNCPYGAQSQLGSGTNVTLQITEKKSKPPVVNNVKPDKGVNPERVKFLRAGDAINISAVAYDPDNGTTSGAGIKQVDFALWRGDSVRALFSDMSAPYAWPVTTSTKCPRGIYMIRITAYSNDGSFTVAFVPIFIYNTMDGVGPYVNATGIEPNYEAVNFIPQQDFIVRTSSQSFMVYSPFSTDSRIVISDLSGRQVTLAQTVKANSWNNIGTTNKLSNSVYFVQTTDEKGNNRIVKKVTIAK
jgi:hypothetical protein